MKKFQLFFYAMIVLSLLTIETLPALADLKCKSIDLLEPCVNPERDRCTTDPTLEGKIQFAVNSDLGAATITTFQVLPNPKDMDKYVVCFDNIPR